MIEIKRVVIWFSAGVTSAVAAKIVVDKYRNVYPVHLVNTDTGSEDDDNYRFMNDISDWIGVPLEIIRNEKYENTFAVYRAFNFIKNENGAKCTVELKKVPRRLYEDLSGDLQVFGYDADEPDRVAKFTTNNPEVTTWFPLIDRDVTKTDSRQILAQAGIKVPRTYAEGFKNANCLNYGCVKGAMGYWNHVRRMRPRVFWGMAKLERELDFALCSREFIGEFGERVKVPVFLDELEPTAGNYDTEPAFQCGLFCSLV